MGKILQILIIENRDLAHTRVSAVRGDTKLKKKKSRIKETV